MTHKNLKMSILVKQDSVQLTPGFTLYCDLDQVLADFYGGVLSFTGHSPNHYSIPVMWQKIRAVGNFFDKLEWTSDGEVFIFQLILPRSYGIALSNMIQ